MPGSPSFAMSHAPLVSVIVPTYNYGHFIEQTLRSLQAQTYQRWECVVVDDGSTDDTAEVVSRFIDSDRRIKFLRQENLRQAAARNNGLKNSSGQYVQFLDADDLLESRKLERQVGYLEQHPEVDIIYGDVRFFNSENPDERLYTMWGENKPWMPGISGRGTEVLRPLVRVDTIPINAALVRRSVIERTGLFDESLPPVEDWDYWVRCAIGDVRFQYQDFEDALALIRSHPSSASKSNLRMAAAEVRLRRKLKTALTDAEARRVNFQLLAEKEGILGAEEVLRRNLGRGIYQLGKAAVLDRQLKHKLKWLSCALAAPFLGEQQFRQLYSSSITRAVTSRLRPPRLNGGR